MQPSIVSTLEKLKKIQDEAFTKLNGLFPSVRYHPGGYKRVDFSAYFTASVWHILSRLQPYFTAEENSIAEKIRLRACQGVQPFLNKQGLPRYNFWQTNPGKHFPNGWLLGRWDYFRPPDDVDDSVMIYQMQRRSREDATWLKQHIDSYANGSKKWIRSTPAPYRKLRAFATFFSKDMPLGFDACVICNVLYFNMLYKLEPTAQDQDSLQYLTTMLEHGDHIAKPAQVAPYYPHSSIILYHLAKLIQAFDPAPLRFFKQQIQAEIGDLLAAPLKLTERQMLESAWMWLSNGAPPATGPTKKGHFYFFVLPLTVEYEGKIAQWFAHKRISHLRFGCQAMEVALALENQVLRSIKVAEKQ